MSLDLNIRAERLALSAPFRISRGVKTHAEVVTVELRDGDGAVGRGECAPYPRYGETTSSVQAELALAAQALADGRTAADVMAAMSAGAARNALDCALWDLTARRDGRSVADRLQRPRPGRMATAVTISLDTPEAMQAAAAAVADAPLLKVKLDDVGPRERLLAVADAAPEARLIVDPNEGWTVATLDLMADVVERLHVILVEQPLPADDDMALKGLKYPAPICADESAHVAGDVGRLLGRYQSVNVKLDKAGGLTAALGMVQQARDLGLGVLAGCMVSSSLSIAPAMWVGALADAVDLDGPWWLEEDRAGGCRIERGVLYPPQRGFWGEAGAAA
ncbi:MAG: dipeptide epimerase [Phenylobacterium sp.]|uniref:N-acetyl-D-Glu racemase DgcA n=1 Tax=Phenylobacterium sp. TaxID=1871053 RepID=UPI001A551391|nr:N-acetyl-D-Glu racemase DgcA [Phenylobacterium sp.]MBL8555322.1 dipeptide epimerase [Phenylobacterium sp.]